MAAPRDDSADPNSAHGREAGPRNRLRNHSAAARRALGGPGPGQPAPVIGNPGLSGEAREPGDRVQGSDGQPVSGKP